MFGACSLVHAIDDDNKMGGNLQLNLQLVPKIKGNEIERHQEKGYICRRRRGFATTSGLYDGIAET